VNTADVGTCDMNCTVMNTSHFIQHYPTSQNKNTTLHSCPELHQMLTNYKILSPANSAVIV